MDPIEDERASLERHLLKTAEIKKIKKLGILCVIAGFFCNFTVFGVSFTYGIFQEFYLSKKGPLFGVEPAKVAIIGTIATSITYMGGALQPQIRKHFSSFTSMFIGSILLSFGMIIASWCNETWQFAMTQGLMFGIGSSLVYMPPIVYCPQYYDRRRGVAMGVVFSGTGFGSLVFAFLSRALITSVGWRWSLRILGLIALSITLTCSFFVQPHPTYRTSSPVVRSDFQVFKSWAFYLQMLCSLFQSMGYLIPLIYMSTYGITLGFSDKQGATFIAINNVVNACSKIVIGQGADYIGRLNMQLICCICSAVTVYALWLVPHRATFLAFVVLYGVASGPIISLLPSCLTEVFGVEVYYSVSGMLYLFRGVGNLLGSPLAGLLIDNNTNSPSGYFNAIQYTGATLVCASIFSLAFTAALRIDKLRKTEEK